MRHNADSLHFATRGLSVSEGIKKDNFSHFVGSVPVKKVHLLEKNICASFLELEKEGLLEERFS